MKPTDISNPLTSRASLLASALTLACATPAAMAATGSWATTTAATGDWSNAANWIDSIPSLAGDTAKFNLNYGSNNRVVVLDGISRTIGNLEMGDTAANYWTVTIRNNDNSGTSGASLTFDNNVPTAGAPATLTNTAPNNTVVDVVAAPVTLTSNLNATISAKGTDGNSFSFTGVVSGPGSITKNGTGGMQLTNNGNSFSGGFILNEGNLHLGGSLALGSGTLTLNGGSVIPRGAARSIPNAVTLGGNFTAGLGNINNSLTFAGPVNLGGGVRTINVVNTTALNDFTLAGVVSNGGLIKDGAGTMVMSGASTYQGATTVSAGTLVLKTDPNPIGTSSGVSVNGAGAKLIVGDTYPSATVSTPVVTLTQGTVDGTATIDSLVVENSPTAIVTAGNGTGNPLQVNSLTFQGSANLNIRATGEFSDQYIIAPTLSTATPGAVTVNMTNTTGSWITGTEYLVIDFDTYATPDATHFTLAPLPGLNPTQTATLINTGTELVVRITGDTLKWSGQESSDWMVGGTGNWTFQFNPAAYANGNAVTFDDSALNFNVNLAQNVSPGNVVFENSLNAYTLYSDNGFGIQSGTLTKGGSEKLTVSTANTYTGATTINGGTLEISGTGSIASSSTITNKGQLIFDLTGGTHNYANPITGAGTITKWGAGALTLSGANTFTGSLTLSEGTLNLNSAGALGTGTTTAITIGGGTLDNSSAGDVVLSSSRAQNWTGDFSYTGTRNLDMGTGNVTATGTTVRTVTVNAGTLTVGELKAQAAGAPGFTKDGAGTLVLTSVGDGAASTVVNGLLTVNGGTLQINRSTGIDKDTTGDLTVNGLAGAGRITNGAAFERWIYVNATIASTFSGTLENGGSSPLGLVKQGVEALTLEGTGTYTGPTRITAGNLIVKNGSALGGSLVSIRNQEGGMMLEGGITVPNDFLLSNDGTAGGAIGYGILNSSGNNTLTGTLSLMDGSGNTLIKSAAGTSLTIQGSVTNGMATLGRALILGGESTGANLVSGVISNGAASATGVNKVDTGTWRLSAANTYTGATQANGGLLEISGTLGNTPVTINNGNLSLQAVGAINQNNLTFATGGTGTLAQTVDNAISGTAGIIVQRPVTLSTPNNYSGNTSINAGDGVALTVTHPNAAGTGRLFASNASTNPRFNLHINGGGTITLPNGLGSNTNVNNTVDVNNNGSGTGGLIHLAGAGIYANGTLNVTGGNGYNLSIGGLVNDATSGTACTLNPTTANITLGTYSSSSNTAKTLRLSGTSTGNSVTGVISNGTAGSVAIEKTGTSTWTLSGDNTYTGNTTVTEGTLSLTKPTLADSSTVVIGAGAVLNLNHSQTDQVAALTINGEAKGPGVYDATNTGGFITGSGKIRVGSTGGYSSWVASYPGFTAGVNDGAEQDADFDGINNVLEYVLGGIPVGPGSNNMSIVPAQTLTNDDLVLTFRRSDASEGDTTVKVQWSSTLGSWNDFVTLGPVSELPKAQITEDSPSPDFDTVVIRIPRSLAASGKIFGRVVATKNP